MENNDVWERIDLPPRIRCIDCPHLITVEERFTEEYLKGVPFSCPYCGSSLDWWNRMLREIKENFMLTNAFTAIGAREVILKGSLQSEKSVHIRFSEYGVPPDARLLHISYTPFSSGNTSLFPLEVHGNNPERHIIRNNITLYPIPLGEAIGNTETKVQIIVTWVPHTEDDESWQSLVDAFEAYVQNRYTAAIIPANIAVESTLSRILTDFLKKFIGKEYVENFLVNAATYSYQLNVVLPLITSMANSTKLPEHIRGLLNRLKDLRNQLAHNGRIDKQLEQNEMAEMLCATLFGFHYLEILKDELQKLPNKRLQSNTLSQGR